MSITNKAILTTTVLQNLEIISREEWLAAGADELEVQRRDICAQHASQAQQRWSPESDPRQELAVCIGKFRKVFSTSGLGLFQKIKEK